MHLNLNLYSIKINYQLDLADLGLCLITGLTCLPYAKRHWELSNQNAEYSLRHKVIAVLECIPVLGGVVAIIERIIALAMSLSPGEKGLLALWPQEDRPIDGLDHLPRETFDQLTHANGHDIISVIAGQDELGNVGISDERLGGDRKDDQGPIDLSLVRDIRADLIENQVSSGLVRWLTVTERRQGNANAEEYLSCVNKAKPKNMTDLVINEVNQFLLRGGHLNIVTDEKIEKKQIEINLTDQVITCCNSGVNRSQVAAALFKSKGLQVAGVLAGGDSSMNEEGEFHIISSTYVDEKDRRNFHEAFCMDKMVQIGFEKFQGFQENPKAAREYYRKYIEGVKTPTHFITFAAGGVSVIRRLLQREGTLEGFTITYIPWSDEIAHPKENSIDPHSKEAYEIFYKKIEDCFHITERSD